ncbi:MAG: DUF1223 domain-containing protein, partial [Acidobacteria bacterium]|nr:DUF1223 domain-containing protein [Acidobacteriota bacterium]
ELFTSEGCSSCPPADAVLAGLDRTQPVKGVEIIALSQHVDYWNRLGWADPFSSPAFSARQGEYARAFGKDGVYTPQMIIDGLTEFPGGNGGRAREAIAKAAQTRKASVSLTAQAQEPEEKTSGRVRLRVNVEGLPAVREGDTAEVLLAVTESDLSINVARGENAGRRLSHVGVVRSLKVIGGVDGKAGGTFAADTVVEFGKGMRREKLRAVVFVQERASRRVLGAAAIRLAE